MEAPSQESCGGVLFFSFAFWGWCSGRALLELELSDGPSWLVGSQHVCYRYLGGSEVSTQPGVYLQWRHTRSME